MSRKYKFGDHDHPHFVTMTVVGWIDFFIRDEYRNVFVESVQYCQKNKGLLVYGYCVMTSHIHMIVGRDGEMELDGILRDMKSFTSNSFHKLIGNTMRVQESRNWMAKLFEGFAKNKSNCNDFQFWQHHNKPVEIWSPHVFDQKLSYMHDNPIEAGFVTQPEHWYYSSARNYAGLSAPIEIVYA